MDKSLQRLIKRMEGLQPELVQLSARANDIHAEYALDRELRDKCAVLQRLTDEDWAQVKKSLPRWHLRRDQNADAELRLFVEAVLWVADTRLGWKFQPAAFGGGRHSNYVRFSRWAQAGVWYRVIAGSGLKDEMLRFSLNKLVNDYVFGRRIRLKARRLNEI